MRLISSAVSLFLNDGIASSPFVIIFVNCSSVCFIACSAFSDGTLICLLSTFASPPSAFGPWHASQFLLYISRACANSSVDGAAAGEAAVLGVVVDVCVGVTVSVQAITTSANATQLRTTRIIFIRQFLRFEWFRGGQRV